MDEQVLLILDLKREKAFSIIKCEDIYDLFEVEYDGIFNKKTTAVLLCASYDRCIEKIIELVEAAL